MEQIGKLVTCDRCGHTIFLERIGTEEWSNRAAYKDLPREWMQESQFGHLCPKCAKEFQTFCKGFFKHVAVAWERALDYEEESDDMPREIGS